MLQNGKMSRTDYCNVGGPLIRPHTAGRKMKIEKAFSHLASFRGPCVRPLEGHWSLGFVEKAIGH